MRDRHEQCPLVDRLDDALVIRCDLDLGPARCLVEVAHGREVALLVDDPAALTLEAEAGENDGLGQRDVLVHRDASGRRADQPGNLVADGHRQLPPAFLPGPDAARPPRSRVVEQALLGRRRHRAERVADQVGRLREDREAVAVDE